jgi:phosphopentomutase
MASDTKDQKIFVIETCHSSGSYCITAYGQYRREFFVLVATSRDTIYRIVIHLEGTESVGRDVKVAHLDVRKNLPVHLRMQYGKIQVKICDV